LSAAELPGGRPLRTGQTFRVDRTACSAAVRGLAALLGSVIIASGTHAAEPASTPGTWKFDNVPGPSMTSQIFLHPGDAAAPNQELWTRTQGQIGAVKIESMALRNVNRPSITPVLPAPGKSNGSAVIVAPGGAFVFLSMKDEGTTVARALAGRGYAAFILKYRVQPTPVDPIAYHAQTAAIYSAAEGADPNETPVPAYRPAIEDGLAALAVVRSRSKEFGIRSDHVGMIGFSAGAMTVLGVAQSAHAGEGPDFIGYIYGPMLPTAVPKGQMTPLFVALALDDRIFAKQDFGIIQSWRAAGVPVELHAYERGGHGFGLGRPGTTTTGMLDQFVSWLDIHGFGTIEDESSTSLRHSSL
jgi:acetyl esterase/lipase